MNHEPTPVTTIGDLVRRVYESPMGGIDISDLGLQYCDQLLQEIREYIRKDDRQPSDIPIFDKGLYQQEVEFAEDLIAKITSWSPATSSEVYGHEAWRLFDHSYAICKRICLINVILNTASE